MLFLGGQPVQLFRQRFSPLHELIDLPLALRGRKQQGFHALREGFLCVGQTAAALHHEEAAPHIVLRQKARSLQVFQPHREDFFIHGPVQAVPPDGRQLFSICFSPPVFKPAVFFVAKDAPCLAAFPYEAHIAPPAVPLPPPVAEEHVPDEIQQGGLAAFIFAHDHHQLALRRLPGYVPVNAVLLQLQISDFHRHPPPPTIPLP